MSSPDVDCTWSEHQYQMDEMVTPKTTPVQGRSWLKKMNNNWLDTL